MSFELPALPYAKNALEPYISEETLSTIMVNTIIPMLLT